MQSGQPNQFVIYALSDPRTGLVRYVGCCRADCQESRRKAHYRPQNHARIHSMWIASMATDGFRPVFNVIARADDRDTARATELFWIRWHRAQGADLTNSRQSGSIASERPAPAHKVRYLTRKGCIPGMRVPA